MDDARPQGAAQWLRVVGNLVNLSTPVGLAVAAVGRSRIRRGPRGLILAEGYRLPFPVAGAFTIGSVIITGSTFTQLSRAFPRLLEHEEWHSWQYLYCLGVGFLPAYAVCTIWSLVRTGDRAAGNFFERQAGLGLGGYLERPTRPISAGLRAGVAWAFRGRRA